MGSISISYEAPAHIDRAQFRADDAVIMLDIIFVATGLAFFIATAAYTAGCAQL